MSEQDKDERLSADKKMIDEVPKRNFTNGQIVGQLLRALIFSFVAVWLLVSGFFAPGTIPSVLAVFCGFFGVFFVGLTGMFFKGVPLRSYTLHLHRCGGERRIGFLPRGKPWVCQHCAPASQVVLQLPVGGLQDREGRWTGPESFMNQGWMIRHWRLKLVGQKVVREANEESCCFFVRATASGNTSYYRGDRGARVLRDWELFQLIDPKDWRSSAVQSDASDWIRGLERRVEGECARAEDSLKRADEALRLYSELSQLHADSQQKIHLCLSRIAKAIADVDGESRLRATSGARKVVHQLLRDYYDCAPAHDELRRQVDVVLAKLAENPRLDVFALLPAGMKHRPAAEALGAIASPRGLHSET